MGPYLNVKRLEFDITYRCNSRCRHCHVEEEKRHARPAAIDPDLAVAIVRQVTQAYRPASLMTFGGEPLLYPEVVYAIQAAARERGIPRREIITNAGRPRAAGLARIVAERLAASGVNDVAVSVDAFHQEHISLEVVERNVRAYLEAGIPQVAWNPCWVVGPTADNPYDQRTRAILAALAHLPVATGTGNILQPAGRARQALPTGSCADVPYAGRLDAVECISIDPVGDVYICWDWSIGNAATQDLGELLDRYDPYAIPEARAILTGEMAALRALAQARGHELDPAGYDSICDMCRSLRRAGTRPAPRREHAQE